MSTVGMLSLSGRRTKTGPRIRVEWRVVKRVVIVIEIRNRNRIGFNISDLSITRTITITITIQRRGSLTSEAEPQTQVSGVGCQGARVDLRLCRAQPTGSLPDT